MKIAVLLIALIALTIASTVDAYGRYRPRCDPDREGFWDKHAFMQGRMTADLDNSLWYNNQTIMTITNQYDGTYVDLIKLERWQRNWYSPEDCAFVSDLFWKAGEGFWRMNRVFSYLESRREDRQGCSASGLPDYKIEFSPQYLLWEQRAAVGLEWKSTVQSADTMFNIAIVPVANIYALNEAITNVRPQEHGYYSINYPIVDYYSLPDWAWEHSHAMMPTMVPEYIKNCANNVEAMPRINDPLAALEGETWEISVCIDPALQAPAERHVRDAAERVASQTNRHETRTDEGPGTHVHEIDGVWEYDTTPLGRLTHYHYAEIMAGASAAAEN